MKRLAACSALAAGVLGAPTVAHAQAEPPPSEDATPRARTGFQLALRTGYMAPFGQADAGSGDSMGNLFSGQVPILVDIGWKPSPNVFLGGYVGVGFGGPGGSVSTLCNQADLSCVAVGFRAGVEAQYQFAPDATANPWVGYGIGVESFALAASGNRTSFSESAFGWEFGHLMAGLDYRASRRFGIGPFVDFSFGDYSTLTVKENGNTQSAALNQAMHEWLLVGARAVFFP